MTYDIYKPEWQPEEGGSAYACQVMTGVKDTGENSNTQVYSKPKKLTVDDYVEGILACDRMILARAITLVESNAAKHFNKAQEIIARILPYTGKARRIGITGVPGAGKSTFIEALGCSLCGKGHKVAILAVDPSSSVSKGSILGDKTRMENLAKQPNAFIRPSPSGGTLGGVTRKSRETILLCEAAGFDTILVETVGVGQGETTVRSMVDFFLYIVLTGAGDDLQGIKKGIMELADAILVNKADGDNKQRALVARADYEQILHYLRPATVGWVTHAYTCSAITGEGIEEIWQVILEFEQQMLAANSLHKRRQSQNLTWVQQMAEEHIMNTVIQNPLVINKMAEIKAEIMADKVSPTMAAAKLIEAMEQVLKMKNL